MAYVLAVAIFIGRVWLFLILALSIVALAFIALAHASRRWPSEGLKLSRLRSNDQASQSAGRSRKVVDFL